MTATRLPDDVHGRRAAIDVLRGGGLVGLPTDTVYGIAVALSTPDGVDRLFAAKQRPPEKAISVLVDGLDQLAALVRIPRAAVILGRVGWPGGLTLVLPLRPEVVGALLPASLTAGTATLGVRVPAHPCPRALARELGPLPTTSANRSGEPDALEADAVARELGPTLDLILDGGRTRGSVASTVVDCATDDGRPRLLRSGAIPPAILAAALDAVGVAHEIATDVPSGA
ncbi:MAG TPA: L-threonylcarbamoyladenylate synthase [Candidatus Limnocylindrales bacterium]